MTVGGEEALDAAGDVADFAGGHDFFFFSRFLLSRENYVVLLLVLPLSSSCLRLRKIYGSSASHSNMRDYGCREE